MQEESADEAT